MSRHILFVVLIIAVLIRFAGSASPSTQRVEPGVRITIAMREYLRTSAKFPIQVVIENTSGKPQGHFDEWNSWGYYNLTLKWTDDKGHSGIVEKLQIGWDKNYPSTTVLKPGEMLVREVTFDPKVWKGWPENPSGLTIQAVYQSRWEAQDEALLSMEKGTAAPWAGTAVSMPQQLDITP